MTKTISNVLFEPVHNNMNWSDLLLTSLFWDTGHVNEMSSESWLLADEPRTRPLSRASGPEDSQTGKAGPQEPVPGRWRVPAPERPQPHRGSLSSCVLGSQGWFNVHKINVIHYINKEKLKTTWLSQWMHKKHLIKCKNCHQSGSIGNLHKNNKSYLWQTQGQHNS